MSHHSQPLCHRHYAYQLLLGSLCAAMCFYPKTMQAAELEETTVLSPAAWTRLDDSIGRGLEWLSRQQQRDGSFPTNIEAQPAVTALCALAFLANGHNVDEGPYGDTVERALGYIISRQKPNGVISQIAPRTQELSRQVEHNIGRTIVYNHAISSIVLSEAYGQQPPSAIGDHHHAIENALLATLQMQTFDKELDFEQGGWRYMHKFESIDSDLSLTGWQLMFLRSAKNAGFEVPQAPIDEAVAYVHRCFDERHKSFSYIATSSKHVTRAMAGAGILALAHAGKHESPMAQQAGDWVLAHSFENYGKMIYGIANKGHHDRYHYGLLLCSQGMYQLGGRHWREFFPKVSAAVVGGQLPSGAWPATRNDPDQYYGKCYVSSLCILALSAPNQLLPIFQR